MFDLAALTRGRRRLLVLGIGAVMVIGLVVLANRPVSAGSRFVEVHDADQLTDALHGARVGDTISLADGRYSGKFTLSASGTIGGAITLRGSHKAVLDGGTRRAGAVVTLTGSYWRLRGFTITGGHVGLVADGAHQNSVDGLLVHDTGAEGVRLRDNSTDNVIQNSKVRDTGRRDPNDGAAIVLGQPRAEWRRGADRSDRNAVLRTTIGPGVPADGVDAHEGTAGGQVKGNTFTGLGQNWVSLAGNDYVVENNSGTGAGRTAFLDRTSGSGYGCGNRFQHNTGSVAPFATADGWAFEILNNGACGLETANVVCDDNKLSGGGGGFSTIMTFICVPDPIPTAPVPGSSWSPPPPPPATAGPAPVPVAGLTAVQVATLDDLVSVFVNGSLTPRYDYIADKHDGCGYRAGWLDFCAAGGDLLDVVQRYSAARPGNLLAQYTGGLLGAGRAADNGNVALGPSFATDWQTAAGDEALQRAQLAVAHDRYLVPAVNLAHQLGVKSLLGIADLYDSAVQLGLGSDACDGVPMIVNQTETALGGTPASGVDEGRWLVEYNELRVKHLTTPCTPGHASDWPASVDRVVALDQLAAAGTLTLAVPLHVAADFDVTIVEPRD